MIAKAIEDSLTPPVLLVLAGPAGSGKTTLCDRLVAEVPNFSRVVTATTRPPRSTEVDGVHYHFLSAEQFDRKIAAGEFLEWAWVHGRDRYGTLKSSVLEPLAAGRSLIINVDVQGVENFRKAAGMEPALRRALTTVFIRLPLEELKARMIKRAQNTEADIARRLQTAEKELQMAPQFDHIIESRTREDDFRQLLKILRLARVKTSATV